MRRRALVSWTALALAAASVAAVPALQASASPSVRAGQVKLTAKASGSGPGSGAGQNLSANVAPSWQTNDPVWSIVASNGDVFVGGQFTSVRPPGDPLGTGEVARDYLAEFNASTGALITSFDPTFKLTAACPAPGPATGPCGVTALAVSPDGSTLYVGGTFTVADGDGRSHLAAFSTSTGVLQSWNPGASATVLSISVSPDGSSIYLGGDFGKLGTTTRNKVGAVSASGAVLPWAPVVNGSVTSVAVAPDDSRVLVGGYFTTFNGVTQQAIGSTDPTTGASATWVLPPAFVPNDSTCVSDVKDIVISGSMAYISAEGTGNGCFDGDFAVNISDGSLFWQNDCLGATQSLAVVNGWLYKGSHAHDCAYTPGGFPQVVNPITKYFLHHLLNQSLTNGALGHWNPNTDDIELGPRVMATDGTQLFVGGGFTTVNNLPQQGFARFAPTPDTTAPPVPAAPTATSTSKGVDSVTFDAVSDTDNGTLTYTIYRDGEKTPAGTVSATSWPWAEPVLHFRDTGRTPGAHNTYTVTASNGSKTSAQSPVSGAVTVSSTSPKLSYLQTVLGDKPSFLWQLGEKSGTTAADASPHGFKGSYEPGTTLGVAGPITGNPETATSFNGKTGLVTAAASVTGPQTFSIEGWFKTSTSTGGSLIGFSNSQTGLGSDYDRQIYLMNDGQLVFGVYNHAVFTIETPRVYNDGKWHYVVATLSPTAGMALYVDGQLIGTSPNKAAEPYTGYWRVGYDNLKGSWNLDFWGSQSQGTTEPQSYFLGGDLGDVAVYPVALSAKQVAAHYAANALSH